MPMETVGEPFSMRFTVRGEHVARSATCAIERLRRSRASLICSPIRAIFCSNFRGNLVPMVFFAILNLSYDTAKIAKIFIIWYVEQRIIAAFDPIRVCLMFDFRVDGK